MYKLAGNISGTPTATTVYSHYSLFATLVNQLSNLTSFSEEPVVRVYGDLYYVKE